MISNSLQWVGRRSRKLIQMPLYWKGQQNNFQFYSFEEEILGLKSEQDTLQQNKRMINAYKTEDCYSKKGILKKSIDSINGLYRNGQLFNFQKETEKLEEDKIWLDKSLEIVVKALNDINNLSIYEKSLVLETFFYNILLAMLSNKKQHTSTTQNAPNKEEIRLMTSFLLEIIGYQKNLPIVLENISLFKYLVKACEIFRIKPLEVIPFIQKFIDEVANDQKLSTLSDISLLLLPISDYIIDQPDYTKSLEKNGTQQMGNKSKSIRNMKIDLSKLSHKIDILLSENRGRSQASGEVSMLSKTLFCMARISGGTDSVCLQLADLLLSSNYQSLIEIEMTSIIYSISKLKHDNDLFRSQLKQKMPNFLINYENKVNKMIQTNLFHFGRVPYILHCLHTSSKYRPSNRQTQVNQIVTEIINIVMKHYDKYKPSEITTIIYSLKLLNVAFQPEIEKLYRAYFLQPALESRRKDSIQDEKSEFKGSSLIQDDLCTKTTEFDNSHQKELLDTECSPISSIVSLNSHSKQSKYVSHKSEDNQKPNQTPEQTKKIQEMSIPLTKSNDNEENKLLSQTTQVSTLYLTPPPKQSLVRNLHMKMPKVNNQISLLEKLQPVDILSLLIGVRNTDKKRRSDLSNSICVINQQLIKVFISREKDIGDTLKIKILYEIAYNHFELLDSQNFEKYFKTWITSISSKLHSLNTHDLIAIGFIMKKFARLYTYHIEFWQNYAQEIPNRSFNHPVEYSRMRLLLQNVLDFYQKCITSSSAQQKPQAEKINSLQIVFDKCSACLSSLSLDGRNDLSQRHDSYIE